MTAAAIFVRDVNGRWSGYTIASMDVEEMITELRTERDRIDEVIIALKRFADLSRQNDTGELNAVAEGQREVESKKRPARGASLLLGK